MKNFFTFNLPIDLASAAVGFLLASTLYLFDKFKEPKLSIKISEPSNLHLSQGNFKSLNLELTNKNYKGFLKFLNRTLTQARIKLIFRDYPTMVPITGLENINARWNSSREPLTPDYKKVDFGSALIGTREVLVPGESTTFSVVIKKDKWKSCYPFNNESYIYQEKDDFKRPGWEIYDSKFYVTVLVQSAEMYKELGEFIVLNKSNLEQFTISKQTYD